jgi:Glycosyltransferase (GlcNAc)
VGLIEMFHRARNDYAVLTTYVADIVQTDRNPSNVPQLCMVEMSNSWRNWGTKFCEHLLRPKLQNVAWGAGLSFSKCHAELNVPYDPFLPNVFNGEELSRGIRFFTHGYDMYTPDQVLVTHDYHGHQSNPIIHTWGHLKNEKKNRGDSHNKLSDDMSMFMHDIMKVSTFVTPQGTERINILMGITKEKKAFETISKSRYGLGDRRTLQDSIDFSGFDPVKRRMTKNTCGNLAWIPFQEDDHFGLERNLKRPIWTKPKDLMAASHKGSPAIEGTDPKSMLDRQALNFKQVHVNRLRGERMDIRNEKASILVVLFFISAMGIILFFQPKMLFVFKTRKSSRLKH